MSIIYEKGNCLQESGTKRIITHVCNNSGGFGKGFALAIAKKYPRVREQYKNQFNLGNFKLGQIQIVKINENLSFINMLAQNGYKHEMNPVPLDYKALSTCLIKIRHWMITEKLQDEIWMPKIGTGLGGGDWQWIEKFIDINLQNYKVKIFEL